VAELFIQTAALTEWACFEKTDREKGVFC